MFSVAAGKTTTRNITSSVFISSEVNL